VLGSGIIELSDWLEVMEAPAVIDCFSSIPLNTTKYSHLPSDFFLDATILSTTPAPGVLIVALYKNLTLITELSKYDEFCTIVFHVFKEVNMLLTI
jgi:hypothetical protein